MMKLDTKHAFLKEDIAGYQTSLPNAMRISTTRPARETTMSLGGMAKQL